MKIIGVTDYTNQTPSKHFRKKNIQSSRPKKSKRKIMKCVQNKWCTSSMCANHYANFEYKRIKTVGVTDYTSQTPSTHFGWKKFNTHQKWENIYQMWTKWEVHIFNVWKIIMQSLKIILTVPRRYFFCGSFMFFLSCVSHAFGRVCLYWPCGHLLGKGWPLGSRLWCLTVSLSLSHWYPGSGHSGVVLDCIDSWSLHPYLLKFTKGWLFW